MRSILFAFVILLVLLELLSLLTQSENLAFRKKTKPDKSSRKPAVLRPKTEKDCPVCQVPHPKATYSQREIPPPWPSRKGRAGRKKRISTKGYFCSNLDCAYYAITDERIHALVSDGSHGKYEDIQDFKCQACGKLPTSWRATTTSSAFTKPSITRSHSLSLARESNALENIADVLPR